MIETRRVAAAQRAVGPGNTVWLASFPKSGNTWLRSIATALQTHEHLFAVRDLEHGSQPFFVTDPARRWGLDPRWLDRTEIDQARAALIQAWSDAVTTGDREVVLRKTHEHFRRADPEPFPLSATRAAILIVRDPRDVACSYAPFFGIHIDRAIDDIGSTRPGGSSPIRMITEQPWNTWSGHVRSWLTDDVPFPVHLIRYEDLHDRAFEVLSPAFTAVGLQHTEQQLRDALEMATFDRLQKSESERGFEEASHFTTSFFRRGIVGSWRDEMTPDQIAAVEADHGDTMIELGYELTTSPDVRASVKDMRDSKRRQANRNWLQLPPWLGIRATAGELPESLPDAVRPRRWAQVTPTQAMVRFGQGSGILVSEGRDVTIEWPSATDSPDDDPSWLLQGWAVTLAMLQRGQLSLHAATVAIGDRTLAIAGDRGAGKSTTSMALRQRGHALLVDDVTLIDLSPGHARTTPYPRNVHLLPDAAQAMGLDFDALPMLAGRNGKAAFAPEDPPQHSRRIDQVVVLIPDSTVDVPIYGVCEGIQRFSVLADNTRRDGLAPIILGPQRYFTLLADLARAVPVHVVRRPTESWSLDEVVALIESNAL